MPQSNFDLHPKLEGDTKQVLDLPLCRVLLMNDCRYPWLILVPRRPDVREIHGLDATDRFQLIEEIAGCSAALEREVDAFKMNFSGLEIKSQHGVVSCDPESGHHIATPGVGGFCPGGSVVAQPSGPVAGTEMPQGREGIGGAGVTRQPPAAVMLHRIGSQGDVPSQLAAITIKPDQALLPVDAGKAFSNQRGIAPWERPAQQGHRLTLLHRSGRPASRSAASRMRQLSQTLHGLLPPL